MRIVWKLLRKHLSITQLAGFCLANLVGMGIVLFGIQFYCDIAPILAGGESFIKKDFVVASKKVSTIGGLFGGDNSFSPEEIADIREQPFTKGVGIFTSSQFRVLAGISIEGTGIHVSTDMFFESVPPAYIDVETPSWGYTPGSKKIPIIIPRNYLNLYNFGFAQSRNMPKISEGLVTMITLDISVRGNGRIDGYKGHIVGFSDRLNTILVPEEFLQWANAEYADGEGKRPVRLIVEVNNPADEEIARYFKEKGYDIEEDKLDAGKTTWFLKIIVGVVMLIGGFITLLSFYILTLSIYLLIQKNVLKLENLLLMGYTTFQVALPYQALALLTNGVMTLFALFTIWVVRGCYMDPLQAVHPQLDATGTSPSLITGLALFFFVSGVNIWIIWKKVKAIWLGRSV